jgi:hypothetical protein
MRRLMAFSHFIFSYTSEVLYIFKKFIAVMFVLVLFHLKTWGFGLNYLWLFI